MTPLYFPTLFAALSAISFVVFALILEQIMEKRLEGLTQNQKKEIPASAAPEIACSSCNQKFTLDRQHCPFCSAPVKSYWFDDNGEKKYAALFSEKGKEYIYFEEKTLPADDLSAIPPALHPYFMDKKRSGFTPFVLTGLLFFLVNLLLILPDAVYQIQRLKKIFHFENYSDMMQQTANVAPFNNDADIARWVLLSVSYFCLLYSVLGLVTGRVWSRYRLVCRNENPIYFHFLIFTQLLFGIWFFYAEKLRMY